MTKAADKATSFSEWRAKENWVPFTREELEKRGITGLAFYDGGCRFIETKEQPEEKND